MIKYLMVLLGMICVLVAPVCVGAQDGQTSVISGTVEQIAEDGSYVVVSGQKLVTSKDFLDSSYLEQGDEIKVTVKSTDQGMEVVDFEYNFEENVPDAAESEDAVPGEAE